ncbi:MAG TPA: alpha/beta fold hydrolase [Chloroflexota bacterium]|jgi:pimeloyl-ACP methyl ester carboxylesterase
MAVATVTEQYVTLSHGKTRYLEAGTGFPTILLHGVGFTAGGDSWLLNLEPLSKEGLRVLAPDFLGWGEGDRLDMEYSFAYLVDFIREFQDSLGIRKSHIVGHSMGGWLASLFAYESPERVEKLVLVAAGGTAPRTLPSMTKFQMPSKDAVRQGVEARFADSGLDLDEIAENHYERSRRPGVVDAYQKILNHMNNPLTRQRYNTLRRLPLITAPTLVVWGRDDTTNVLEMGEKTHQLIPGSKLVIFDQCGHFVPTDQPTKFNHAVADFLRPQVVRTRVRVHRAARR